MKLFMKDCILLTSLLPHASSHLNSLLLVLPCGDSNFSMSRSPSVTDLRFSQTCYQNATQFQEAHIKFNCTKLNCSFFNKTAFEKWTSICSPFVYINSYIQYYYYFYNTPARKFWNNLTQVSSIKLICQTKNRERTSVLSSTRLTFYI